MIGNALFYEPNMDVPFVSGMRHMNSHERHASSTMAKYIFNATYMNCELLEDANYPVCEYIGGRAFMSCYRLSSISLPQVKYIGTRAFESVGMLLSTPAAISCPQCTYVESYAFASANIGEAFFPKLSRIGKYAFEFTPLQSINFDSCTLIEDSAFIDCIFSVLDSASFPMLSDIYTYAFAWNYSLLSVNLPEVTFCGTYAFRDARSLTHAIFPKLKAANAGLFYYCVLLSYLSLPLVSAVYTGAFEGTSALTDITLPACTTLYTSAFYRANGVQTIHIPICMTIGNYAFTECSKLKSIYLTSVSSVPTLGSSAFQNTVRANYCDVYVPMSLVSDFIVAPNWSFSRISSRIIGV